MDNEQLIHALNLGSVILACMSATCLIATAVGIYRAHRRIRSERPSPGSAAASR